MTLIALAVVALSIGFILGAWWCAVGRAVDAGTDWKAIAEAREEAIRPWIRAALQAVDRCREAEARAENLARDLDAIVMGEA